MTHLSRYTCEEAFRRLDDYLDRELSSEETVLVKEHLEICAGCAREFNFEDSLLKGVRSKLRQIELPPTIKDDLSDVPPAGIAMAKPNGDHKKVLESGRWKNAIQGYLAAILTPGMRAVSCAEASAALSISVPPLQCTVSICTLSRVAAATALFTVFGMS